MKKSINFKAIAYLIIICLMLSIYQVNTSTQSERKIDCIASPSNTTFYDEEGNILSVSRESSDDVYGSLQKCIDVDLEILYFH